MLRAAAALHCESLPGSAISRVGETFARSFYRYAARSPAELVFAACDGGATVAAAVLSLRPHDLGCRLLSHTSLMPHMAVHPFATADILRDRLFTRVTGEIDP